MDFFLLLFILFNYFYYISSLFHAVLPLNAQTLSQGIYTTVYASHNSCWSSRQIMSEFSTVAAETIGLFP